MHLRQAFKLALSLVLFYWLALSLNWELANYGALAIVLVSLGTRGASLTKGFARVFGTTLGVVIGFVVVAMFNHDRWATMLALAGYLTLVGYGMQGSRNDYAWYVTAFVPLVVWGDNYPNFENSFYFGTFRWLETTAGILIYTLVDLVFWPRHSGDQLGRQGQQLWDELNKSFSAYQAEIQRSGSPDRALESSGPAESVLVATTTSLNEAFSDTPMIRAQKQEWHNWQSHTEILFRDLELAHESTAHCLDFDLHRCVPHLDSGLQKLKQRFERIGVSWQQHFATEQEDANRIIAGDDAGQLETISTTADTEAVGNLSHAQRAALSCFVSNLKAVEGSSRNVLHSIVLLSGSSDQTTTDTDAPRFILKSQPWRRQRLVHALFPAVTFIVAFMFWVFVNPPAGAKIPMMAGIFSLALLRTPMNPVPLLGVLSACIFITFAPVYWFIMPGLETGLGLLALVFVYALLFGYLGGSRPILKSGPLIVFVNMAGISNNQRYSFQGPVDGALMMVIGLAIVALVYQFFSPLRPERTLMLWIDRFFTGCARFTEGLGGQSRDNRTRARALRIDSLQSMVVPAPAAVQAVQQHLNQKLFPDDSKANLDRLHDRMQSLSYRLQSLELAFNQVELRQPDLDQPLVATLGRLKDKIQEVFQCWAQPQSGLSVAGLAESFEQLSRDLKSQLNALRTDSNQQRLSEQASADRYTLLGSIRGLIDAMAGMQTAMAEIDWKSLSNARF